MTDKPAPVEQVALQSWRIERPQGADAGHLVVPAWVQQRQLMIGGFLEQGWAAYDQTDAGRMVATGQWGDELIERADGTLEALARQPLAARVAELEAGLWGMVAWAGNIMRAQGITGAQKAVTKARALLGDTK